MKNVSTDKQKEIERMVQIAYNYSKEFANTPYYKGVYTDMEAVFEAGYRKADEVRKETAKEILMCIRTEIEHLEDIARESSLLCALSWYDNVKYLANAICEKFSVEVDE